MSNALDTPWKASNHLHRLLILPFARTSFAFAGIRWGSGWQLFGLPVVQKHRLSTIAIGDRLSLRSTVRSNPLGPNHPVIISTREPGSHLTIGNDFAMTGGSIVAAERVTIGDRVTIGANCTITDTDFHPIDPQKRIASPVDGATAPVAIGDDVFIGMSTIVLKGVTIGSGSTIGAGSVVTGDIPPGVVAAGNPATVIRPI